MPQGNNYVDRLAYAMRRSDQDHSSGWLGERAEIGPGDAVMLPALREESGDFEAEVEAEHDAEQEVERMWAEPLNAEVDAGEAEHAQALAEPDTNLQDEVAEAWGVEEDDSEGALMAEITRGMAAITTSPVVKAEAEVPQPQNMNADPVDGGKVSSDEAEPVDPVWGADVPSQEADQVDKAWGAEADPVDEAWGAEAVSDVEAVDEAWGAETSDDTDNVDLAWGAEATSDGANEVDLAWGAEGASDEADAISATWGADEGSDAEADEEAENSSLGPTGNDVEMLWNTDDDLPVTSADTEPRSSPVLEPGAPVHSITPS